MIARKDTADGPEQLGWRTRNVDELAARKDEQHYLGVAQLAARVIWVHQAVSSSLTTQTIGGEEENE